MANEIDVPFLGAIPIEPSVCAQGDRGQTFVQSGTKAGGSFSRIVERLIEMF